MGQEPLNKISLLSQHVWLGLSQKTRDELVRIFDLKKSGTTMTNIGPNGAVVVSDGFNFNDFWPITVESLQNVLMDSSGDFYELFNELVFRIENPNFDESTKETIEIIEIREETVKEKPRRGRLPRQAIS